MVLSIVFLFVLLYISAHLYYFVVIYFYLAVEVRLSKPLSWIFKVEIKKLINAYKV